MDYKIIITHRFSKDFKKLPRNIQRKTISVLNEMAKDPYKEVEKVLAKETGEWRKRIGDYRIRYDISGKEVILYRVLHRREIYKK